jgi:hypothetical protein
LALSKQEMPMPDDPQVQRMSDGEPGSDGLADTPQDTAGGIVKPQDGALDRPGTEAGDEDEPMTNEPVPVAEDGAGVGLSQSPEETIDGNRGM